MPKLQTEEGKIRFLVTGGNGFVGRALCDLLIQHGHDVLGTVRRDVTLNSKILSVVIEEINNQTDWSEALEDVEVIIHLAARVHVMHEKSKDPLNEFRSTNVYGTEHLARSAAAHGVRRLVYVSSIKVNGELTVGGHSYTELDVASPQDSYAVSKWEAEQALHRVAKETGLEIVILRPSLVYGVEAKGNFVQLIKALAKGMPLPLASVRNLRSLLYLGNFVDALLQCARHPAAAGQTYLVNDGEDVSTPALLRMLGAAMGHPARLLSCPPVLLRLAGRLFGRLKHIDRLLNSLQVDSSKIRQELDWQPPFTLQQGLQATADWYRTSKL